MSKPVIFLQYGDIYTVYYRYNVANYITILYQTYRVQMAYTGQIWTRSRRPMSRPYGRAMERLPWAKWIEYAASYQNLAVYSMCVWNEILRHNEPQKGKKSAIYGYCYLLWN